jgi:hypothetical protein
MPNNGSLGLASFVPPTIGEAVMEGAVLLISVRCPCQQHVLAQSQYIAGQWLSTQAICPKCQMLHAVKGFGLDAQGSLHIELVKGSAALPNSA